MRNQTKIYIICIFLDKFIIVLLKNKPPIGKFYDMLLHLDNYYTLLY